MSDIVVTTKQRHRVNFDPGLLRMRMLGHIGDYDVWYDPNDGVYTVAGPATRAEVLNSLNYTDYGYLPTGDIAPRDADVVLDPYHMCLLYQLVAEVGDPAKARTGA